ncbi:MAG: hypothetical protein AAF702_40970 [Chloroflexota bacterium]
MSRIAKAPFDTSRYDMSNIHRQERSERSFWWLKIQRNGRKFSRAFVDADYGSAKMALMEAIIERERFVASNPKLPFQLHTTKANSTNVNGVSYSPTTGSKGAFYATWVESDTGKAVCKKFYIASNGFMGALRKAIDARREWEEKVLEDSKLVNRLNNMAR